jgi:hypothetical protein
MPHVTHADLVLAFLHKVSTVQGPGWTRTWTALQRGAYSQLAQPISHEPLGDPRVETAKAKEHSEVEEARV